MEQNKKLKNRPLIDRSVWFTLGIFSIIGIFVTGYKYFAVNNYPAPNFIIEGKSFTVGELVTFKDTTSGTSDWKWTFGDDSKAEKQKEVLHVYKHPGTYIVILKVDERPAKKKKITIEKREKLVDPSRYPAFSMPSTANVGERVHFTDHTKGAKTWEWSFGESMHIDASTKDPSYVFNTPGKKIITLIVNGKNQFPSRKRLTVFAKPMVKPGFDFKPQKKVDIQKLKPVDTLVVTRIPTGPALRPKQENIYPEINRIQLEDYLLQVSEEKRKPETLNQFFCKGYKTRVRINGEENTLQALLQEFKGKKLTLKTLEIIKDKQTKCINYMKLDYKKHKIFGIF